MAPTITVDGDEIIDASIDGDAVEEITIDGDLAWAAAVGLDGLTVTRQDGSYTASNGEHVVSNGGTITLPSAVQDGVVMITEVQTRPRLTGSVDGIADPYIRGDESVVFVSDGSAWYSVDRNQIYAIPDSGISRWEYEQDLTDSWGSNDATSSGGITYTTNSAVGSYAIDFDAVDDRVEYGTIPETEGLAEFSASVWAYNRSSDTNNGFLVKKDNPGGAPDNQIRISATDTDGYYCAVETGGTRAQIFDFGTFPLDTYTHVVLTFNSGTMTIYENGSELTSETGGPDSTPSSNLAWFSGYIDGGAYADIIADDPRMYNKELTATEVSNLYNTGSISG